VSSNSHFSVTKQNLSTLKCEYFNVNMESNHSERQEPETLKALRQTLDLTQEELSRRLNLSFRTVGDWETGKKVPRFDNAITLSKELGVSLKTLAAAMGINADGVPSDYRLIDLKALAAELGIERVEDLPESYEILRQLRNQ